MTTSQKQSLIDLCNVILANPDFAGELHGRASALRFRLQFGDAVTWIFGARRA